MTHSDDSYVMPVGGLPPQTNLLTGRAIFKDAYAVIPRGVMTDIVTSYLPFWEGTRAWVIARPMSGFSETFSQYIMEVIPGGGSNRPETEPDIETVLFMVSGQLEIELDGELSVLETGGYAYIAPGSDWRVSNEAEVNAGFHLIRKKYDFVKGIDVPPSFITEEDAHDPIPMPDTDGAWATTRFVDPSDIRHDMHVNVVTFQPGGVIPFLETHVMEHGLYVLEGKAFYKLNDDWVEVEAGDFMWLRAFCPQACYAGGPGPFKYLLYKDVNRHMKF